MNDRAVVVVSLLWVGLLVVLSRSWLGDVKDYVRTATGHVGALAATASSSGKSGLGPDGSAGGGSQGGGGGSW